MLDDCQIGGEVRVGKLGELSVRRAAQASKH
jgi:hypothetical protein